MSLPAFAAAGDLPPGIHRATLSRWKDLPAWQAAVAALGHAAMIGTLTRERDRADLRSTARAISCAALAHWPEVVKDVEDPAGQQLGGSDGRAGILLVPDSS